MKKHHYMILGLGILALSFSALAQKPSVSIKKEGQSCAEKLEAYEAGKSRMSKEERNRAKADLKKQGCAVPADGPPDAGIFRRKDAGGKDHSIGGGGSAGPAGGGEDGESAEGSASPVVQQCVAAAEPTHDSYMQTTMEIGVDPNASFGFADSHDHVSGYDRSPLIGRYDLSGVTLLSDFITGLRVGEEDNFSPFTVPGGIVRLRRLDSISEIHVEFVRRLLEGDDTCQDALLRIRPIQGSGIMGERWRWEPVVSQIVVPETRNRSCIYNVDLDVATLLELDDRERQAEHLLAIEFCTSNFNEPPAIWKSRAKLEILYTGSDTPEFIGGSQRHWNTETFTVPTGDRLDEF